MESKFAILTVCLLIAQFFAQNIDQGNYVKELLDTQISYCERTDPKQSVISEQERAYYRGVRTTLMGIAWTNTFEYYEHPGAFTWLMAMQWESSCLLTLGVLSAISWLVYIAFCCSPWKVPVRNEGRVTVCVAFGWVIYFILFGLFVVIIIWNGIMEVYGRRSRCQLAVVSSFIVNGYINQYTGSQYAGLQSLLSIATSLQTDISSLNSTNVLQASSNVVLANPQGYYINSKNSLVNIQTSFANTPITTPWAGGDAGYSTRNMNQYLNSNDVQYDFDNLKLACYGIHLAAQSTLDFITTNGINRATSALNQMNVFLNQWLIDASSAGYRLWNRGYERWQYVWGGYWTNFCITVIIMILYAVLLAILCSFCRNSAFQYNVFILKVILAVIAFFVVFYVACVIIMMAGQTALATFCSVLAQVNLNNTSILDKIATNFTSYNKIIIKECTAGDEGNLLKYAYLFQAGSNYGYNFDIQTVYPGLNDYKMFRTQYPLNTVPPSISYLMNNYTAIMNGNQEDYPAVFDSALALKYFSGTTNEVVVGSCTSGSSCTSIAGGNTIQVSNVNNQAIVQNIYNTLRKYLATEKNVLTILSNSVLGSSSFSNSPNANWQRTVSLLYTLSDSVAVLLSAYKNTMAQASQYKGYSYDKFDCRKLRTELYLLEDNVCFHTNYFAWIVVVLMAISACLFFILMWMLCIAIYDVDTQQTQPVIRPKEQMVNTNEQERIPSI